MDFGTFFAELWRTIGWPLSRLCLSISFGLFVANLIEALNWTHAVAKLAAPLVRLGRLSDITGASFSMAFFSGISSNAMLAEGHAQGKISRRELILANLFNSLPTYFLHLPNIFFLAVPLIKSAAFAYVGITFLAAILRTFSVLVAGRFILPPLPPGCVSCRLGEGQGTFNFQAALAKAWERFRKRVKNIILFTIPIYLLFHALNRLGFFLAAEEFFARHVGMLPWLSPESIGIIMFHIAAEFTAGLAAAGALLDAGKLPTNEIILALLIGNILSSPVRAIRHQFPYYAGIFNPKLAAELIICNQLFRMASVALLTVGYYVIAF